MAEHRHLLAPRRDREVERAVAVDVADGGGGEGAGRGQVDDHVAVAVPPADTAVGGRGDDVLDAVTVPVDERRRALDPAGEVEAVTQHHGLERHDAHAAVHAAGDDLGDPVAVDVADRGRREGRRGPGVAGEAGVGLVLLAVVDQPAGGSRRRRGDRRDGDEAGRGEGERDDGRDEAAKW